METKFLGSLVAVIETGSIAGAARKQKLTAAAISQRVKVLENTFNCQLLTRVGHSAKPTENCLKILPRLLKIEALVAQIDSDLDTTGLTGTLKVGVISSVLSGCLPDCIAHLSTSAPNLTLQIVPGTSAQLYQQLQLRTIDVAILVQPAFQLPKVIQEQLLFCEPLLLISQQPIKELEQAIQQQPFIQYDRQAWGGSIAHQFLADHDLTPNVLCEIDALETIAFMVSKNMGTALVPKWEGLSNLLATLHYQAIEDKKYQRCISILSHRQSPKQTLIAEFKRVINIQYESAT
jgi:DNA-binding transcriptional LysR family regulator